MGSILKGTVVTYWYQHNQGREEALKKMIDRFNATNPWGITVKGEYAGGYSDIANKMTAAIAGGSTPDLVVAYQNNAATYELSDALVDLNPYVADAKFGFSKAELADFFPGFLAQDVNPQFGGKRLGWPPNRSIEVLYYNADWLKALGIAALRGPGTSSTPTRKTATDSGQRHLWLRNQPRRLERLRAGHQPGRRFPGAGGVEGYGLDSPQMKASFALFGQDVPGRLGEEDGRAVTATRPTSPTGRSSSRWARPRASLLRPGDQEGAGGAFAWSVAPIPARDGRRARPRHLRRLGQHREVHARKAARRLALPAMDERERSSRPNGSAPRITSPCGGPPPAVSGTTWPGTPSSPPRGRLSRRAIRRRSRPSWDTSRSGTPSARRTTPSSTAPISTRLSRPSTPGPTGSTGNPSLETRSPSVSAGRDKSVVLLSGPGNLLNRISDFLSMVYNEQCKPTLFPA